MIAQAFVPPQLAKAAPLELMGGDALATAPLPVANSNLFPDPVLTVLVRMATDWSAPTLTNEIHVNTGHGRIHMTGHVDNASPLKSLKRILPRLPGVGNLDMAATVEALTNPLRMYPAAQHSQHVG